MIKFQETFNILYPITFFLPIFFINPSDSNFQLSLRIFVQELEYPCTPIIFAYKKIKIKILHHYISSKLEVSKVKTNYQTDPKTLKIDQATN